MSPGITQANEEIGEILTTKKVCDIYGLENLETSAAALTEKVVRESIKETITLAQCWSKKCARRRLTVADVENVLRVLKNTGNWKLPSVDTLNYGFDQLLTVPGSSNVFYYSSGDIEVDKEDTETFSEVPRDLRLICEAKQHGLSTEFFPAYSLVGDGHLGSSSYTINQDDEDDLYFEKCASIGVANTRTETPLAHFPRNSCAKMFLHALPSAKIDQKVGLKPVSVETLTLEQQVFMKDIITVCMGQDDKKRLEALYTLETDAGLQVLLPHLVLRVCKSISANISQRCLSLIIYAGRVLRAISHNKSCDMTVTLHNVLPALLSCCVGRSMCLKPETDNHWALRDFSAKTLVGLIRDQVDKRDEGETSRRLFNYACSVFKSQKSSFSMIYGTIYILEEFVEIDKMQWLINEFSEMMSRCKNYIESSNRHVNHLFVQEASKLHGQILKCDGLLKNRMNSLRSNQ